MIQEFLNFVDQKTNFGKEFISGERLFELFVTMKNLNANTAYGFHIRLAKRGIL